MKLRHLFAVLLLGVLPVTAARAGFSITIAPPVLLTYDQPVCPTEGYLWTPGYWAFDYDAGDYYWVNGVWVPPPRIGYLWTPGYWGYNDGFYGFNEGYWGPTVGFYGGINYGYGYGGYGYYGGRWEGRNFRYNTAITRVNTRFVHNTYVDRNAIHNMTSSRTSFNGRGGIKAQPDAKQLAASRGSHIRATSAQTKVLSQARTAHASTARRTANNRAQTTSPTRNGRNQNVVRGPGNSRTGPAHTNGTRSNGRTPPTTASRGSRNGGTQPAFTRSPGRNGSGNPGNVRTNRGPQVSRGPQVMRGPQVTRQTRAPQPQRQPSRGNDKKHP